MCSGGMRPGWDRTRVAAFLALCGRAVADQEPEPRSILAHDAMFSKGGGDGSLRSCARRGIFRSPCRAPASDARGKEAGRSADAHVAWQAVRGLVTSADSIALRQAARSSCRAAWKNRTPHPVAGAVRSHSDSSWKSTVRNPMGRVGSKPASMGLEHHAAGSSGTRETYRA